MSELSAELVWEVRADFNDMRRDGRLTVLPPMILKPGDRVVVRDDEGNSCEGVVERVPNIAHVRCDRSTWQGGPDEEGTPGG